MRITVYTNAPECFEDMSEVLRVFYPGAEIAQIETPDAFLRHERSEREGWVTEKYDLQGEKFQWTAPLAGDGWEVKRRRRRSVKQGCYWLLRRATGKRPPWGSLTGIRPTRLFYERLEKGDAPLSDSLKLFEEGTKLVNQCRSELDKAEQQVVKLMKGPDGTPVESNFLSEE